jgi:hypothetical protein
VFPPRLVDSQPVRHDYEHIGGSLFVPRKPPGTLPSRPDFTPATFPPINYKGEDVARWPLGPLRRWKA